MVEPFTLLLNRGDDDHLPSLENRVGFQWEPGLDTLGHRNATTRDAVVLGWLSEAVDGGSSPLAVLDIGCGYGNHILMLNARLGKKAEIDLIGVDLFPDGLEYANAFAAYVQGYGNCTFRLADLEEGLPFPDHIFDAVNIADVLEHLVDPLAALTEIVRVAKPAGTIVFSTPLKTSVFKSLSKLANRASHGRIERGYYEGKGVRMEHGRPIMDVQAGHDHISEMKYSEIVTLASDAKCTIVDTRMMQIMSGSQWFDRHPFLLSGILLLEAVHETLQRPSWAHGVVVRLRTPA